MAVYTFEQHFAKWACDRLTEDANFGKKKIIFSCNKQNCYIWGIKNTLAYIEKPTHPNRVTIALSVAELMSFGQLGAAI